MKKIQLLFAALFLVCTAASAQKPYSLTVSSQTYQPLTGTTSINNGLVWDEERFSVPLPFSFKYGSSTVNKFNLLMDFPSVATDTTGVVTGFILSDADLADRSFYSGGVSSSPIRYTVSGTSPNRIFKAEIANAGFYNQYDIDTTMGDSVSLQAWLYETSNIFEIHFGPSRITHANEYFNFSDGPIMGYGFNLDIDNGAWDKLYTLSGAPGSPAFDSVASVMDLTGLDSYPVNGTVYRFTPAPATGIERGTLASAMKIYPTATNQMLFAEVNLNKTLPYMVFATDGKLTAVKGTLQKGRNQVDVSSLPAGQYFLVAADGGSHTAFRFTKL